MQRSNGRGQRGAGRLRLVAITAAVTATVAIGILMLLINIVERKQEARNPFYRVVELDDNTEDPAIWGKNFPIQYDTYRRTVDQERTRFGGSEAVPRTPTAADPRSVVAQSRLEEDPRLKIIWAGYPFARDFREERGHALKADEILAYYEETGFKDWTHADSGAPALKAQHPEFEMWNQGIHARSGVACADCHMPYQRVGALKISDHHVRSPLLNISRACQTCHKWPEEELKARAVLIQERTHQLRDVAMDALVALIGDLKAARAAGKSDAQLGEAQNFQRRAQFLLDFIEAENSMGFHAPQEAARVLGLSIDYSRKGQLALRK